MARTIVAILVACIVGGGSYAHAAGGKKGGGEAALSIDYEKYTLENGLQVILHLDRSDPIVAVAVLFHVGSNREVPGKTGFAHLFEHILFQESKNVGQDEFIRKIQELGGTLNGGTWEDGTVYYEVVPKNALETVLWMESDRMGWVLDALTPESFRNQQLVVMNEKRQRVDNVQYGHVDSIMAEAMFPEGHPYSWTVIGSMQDLAAATLADVKGFFNRFYGPGNATLVIAGDFDAAQAKAWVAKYFGEIQAGPPVPELEKKEIVLERTQSIYYLDHFAKVPELNVVWPTVPAWHEDEAPLDLLAMVLEDGKNAVMFKTVVEEMQATSAVNVGHLTGELAGRFSVSARASGGKGLSELQAAIEEAFKRFESNGIDQENLKRIKAKFETRFYHNLQSVLSKSFTLAVYNVFKGDPGYLKADLDRHMAVTSQDILRVYEKYIRGKHSVVVAAVPADKKELALPDAVEHKPDANEPPELPPVSELADAGKVASAPSSFDRSVPPTLGPVPEIRSLSPYTHRFKSGLRLMGLTNDELPLVRFSVMIDGGHAADPQGKPGLACLTSAMMNEGTAKKTPAQFEHAVDILGSTLTMSCENEALVLEGESLSRNLEETLELAFEMLTQPRFDARDFERLKLKALNRLEQMEGDARTTAHHVFLKILYGENHPLGFPKPGSRDYLEKATLKDVQDFYLSTFAPSAVSIAVVGDLQSKRAHKAFSKLHKGWPSASKGKPFTHDLPPAGDHHLYLVDFPGARQAEIRIGRITLASSDERFFPATVMNYPLGGTFNSTINLVLREEKGYTYGANSAFIGGRNPGPFLVSTAVQTDAAAESVAIIMGAISAMQQGMTAEQLGFTRDSMLLSMTREFETPADLLELLRDMLAYNLPKDTLLMRQKTIATMDSRQSATLALELLELDKMIYLILGDAASIAPQLDALELGKPVILDRKGVHMRQDGQ